MPDIAGQQQSRRRGGLIRVEVALLQADFMSDDAISTVRRILSLSQQHDGSDVIEPRRSGHVDVIAACCVVDLFPPEASS